jgi:hypothetical protein
MLLLETNQDVIFSFYKAVSFFEEVFTGSKSFDMIYSWYLNHKVVDKKSAQIAALFKT